MSLAQRWEDIRTGFARPFWVANLSELFERLSYYAAFASLARYLHFTLPGWFPPASHRDNWQTSAWGRISAGAADPVTVAARDDHF